MEYYAPCLDGQPLPQGALNVASLQQAACTAAVQRTGSALGATTTPDCPESSFPSSSSPLRGTSGELGAPSPSQQQQQQPAHASRVSPESVSTSSHQVSLYGDNDNGTAPAQVDALEVSGKDGLMSLVTHCILELHIRNCSERYFKAWLAKLPPEADNGPPLTPPADLLSSVVQPGDAAPLLACIPSPAPSSAENTDVHHPSSLNAAKQQQQQQRDASGQGPVPPEGQPGSAAAAWGCQLSTGGETRHGGSAVAGMNVADGGGPQRMACAEQLAEEWAVCWEMFTGEASSEQLPQGMVRLTASDVAKVGSTMKGAGPHWW